MWVRSFRAAMLAGLATLVLVAHAEARITRVEVARVEPAFGGRSFDPRRRARRARPLRE